jgi:hypothetical protein
VDCGRGRGLGCGREGPVLRDLDGLEVNRISQGVRREAGSEGSLIVEPTLRTGPPYFRRRAGVASTNGGICRRLGGSRANALGIVESRVPTQSSFRRAHRRNADRSAQATDIAGNT